MFLVKKGQNLIKVEKWVKTGKWSQNGPLDKSVGNKITKKRVTKWGFKTNGA